MHDGLGGVASLFSTDTIGRFKAAPWQLAPADIDAGYKRYVLHDSKVLPQVKPLVNF